MDYFCIISIINVIISAIFVLFFRRFFDSFKNKKNISQ